MRDRVNDLRKRAKQSWWRDGIVEAVSGLGITFIGAVGTVGYMLEGRISGWYYAFFVVIIVALAFLTRWAVLRAKEMWVWPLTGYGMVEGRSGRRIVLIYIVVFPVLLVAFVFPKLTTLVSGVIGSIILLSLATYSGVRRFYLFSALSFILAVILYFLKVPTDVSTYVLLSGLGGVLFASGIAQFVKFRREVEGENEA